jgi:5'-nucleotidase
LERLAALAPFPAGLFFNVNLPGSQRAVRGVRLTRHGLSGFREFYRPSAPPPGSELTGACYYEVDGEMTVNDPDDWTDAAALAAGYVSVTPMLLDLSAEPLRRREAAPAAALAALLDQLAGYFEYMGR